MPGFIVLVKMVLHMQFETYTSEIISLVIQNCVFALLINFFCAINGFVVGTCDMSVGLLGSEGMGAIFMPYLILILTYTE